MTYRNGPRVRTKNLGSTAALVSGTSIPIGDTFPYEYFYESATPGPCNCLHWTSNLQHIRAVSPGFTFEYRDLPAHYTLRWGSGPTVQEQLHQRVDPSARSLNWSKLPTSNETGIVELIAEMDDTLAMFTSKWWGQLSYGSTKWGLVPFLSDLLNTAKVLKGLTANLSAFDYEDSVDMFLYESADPVQGWRLLDNSFVNLRWTGVGDISYYDPFSVVADRIGFHPDTAVWELIPLSFLVDYFLPVGNFIENLRPGGWIRTMNFRGWITMKGRLKVKLTPISGFEHVGDPYEIKFFERINTCQVLEVPDEPYDWDVKLKELFDVFYVLALPKLDKKLQLRGRILTKAITRNGVDQRWTLNPAVDYKSLTRKGLDVLGGGLNILKGIDKIATDAYYAFR